MSAALALKLREARALRAIREKQLKEFESEAYLWMESCATVSYTVEHVKDQVVEFLKSNPLESVQARIVRTLQTWLAAHTEARAAQSRTPRRSTGSISDDQVDEDDVVTVTKIQFLEQQLAELRALMMQPGAMPAPPPPQPVRSSADVEVHVFASAPQEPVVIVAKPQSYPVSEPATIRVDTGAAPEPLRASASETCAFVSPPASVSTRPAAPATPARPNMVSLVAQASAVKLKAAATPRKSEAQTPSKISRPSGLEALLQSAFQSKFAGLQSVSESDSDDDFGGPSFGSPKQQRATRPALSKSAVEPRRKSLRTEKPVDVNVPIGITTADTNPLAVEQDESSSLSRSLPPKPVGLPIGAMLSDIQSFKKDKLKTVEPVPTAVPLPNASSGVVARGKPAPPPKRGSLMADMKTVSLRKTGILQERSSVGKEN